MADAFGGLATPLSRRRLGTWAGGALVALLSWRIAFGAPGPGLDASWNGGLAMAVQDGMHFGTEIVFTYGPLGFLQSPFAWYQDLALLSFLFLAAQYLAFCVGLVWALRRRLPLLASIVGALAIATLLMLFDYSLLIGLFACVWLLERERAPRALDAFVVLGASFAAVVALMKLSTGPLVAVLFLVALLGARAGRWRIAAFVGLLLAELLALWLATGQSLATVPVFVQHTLAISSGYSEAMLRQTTVAPWKVTLMVAAAAIVSLLLLLATWFGGYRDRRARWAALVVVGLTTFAIYKEGVVRTDLAHATLFFANACVLWLAVGLSGERWRAMLAVAAAVALLSVPVRPPDTTPNLKLEDNVRTAFDQLPNLFSSSRREAIVAAGRSGMQATYALEPGALAALRGRSVAVEPWEVGAAWAYELSWRPLPVFQSYSAYTPELDRLNSAAVEDPDGPERILRENAPLVYAEFPDPDIDGRYLGWDPPEQARAVLCHFAPLFTSERWQVLGRTADRCGPPRALGSVSAGEGEAVPVPAPARGEVVFVRIEGAGVAGLERLTTSLLHAAVRRVIVNGGASFRLIPATAGDGLLLRAAPDVAEPGPFWPMPEATTIAVEGAPGDLTYDFYALPLRPAGPASARAAR